MMADKIINGEEPSARKSLSLPEWDAAFLVFMSSSRNASPRSPLRTKFDIYRRTDTSDL